MAVGNGQMGQSSGNTPGPRKAGIKGLLGKAAFGGGTTSLLAWGAFDTIGNMKQGDDIGTAAVKGLATGMLWTAAPGAMMAYTAATAVPEVALGYNTWKRKKQQWWNEAHLPSFGGQYQDSQRALTMRQAAVQQIQGSKLNARSALGGEARIMHQNAFRG